MCSHWIGISREHGPDYEGEDFHAPGSFAEHGEAEAARFQARGNATLAGEPVSLDLSGEDAASGGWQDEAFRESSRVQSDGHVRPPP